MMKQAVTRELFEYWNALRGSRIAPMRDDIDPGAIRARLADIFLLALNMEHGHAFRLAGSSVCALFGKELKGGVFHDLWSPISQPRIGALLHSIAEDKVGAVAHVIGRNLENEILDLEMILLPLLDGSGSVSRLLGGFAPVGAPYWIGSRAVEAIDLEDLRYVGPALDTTRGLISGRNNPLPRAGLVIYPAQNRQAI
ncbi:PAS domain-containing protein [Pseudorhodoplanes sinuspersici]|uniref:Uncharacterized protein n=1 Tax=Pseudorhodoplanes sinuspersici TaxID=1235591 RepID=A0A1W6ZV35_9HYPH|nr:PAS domain-containing protein [Pseudorhodoplanes sinuspersici]ARQ01244.1 hypothetical protein CAK95_20715 [Pseudorhodoplanes sinuspersici]RKE72919.1 hypothetical protein DFP91_0792 [Pseudorhodoplanes sinuspersici]